MPCSATCTCKLLPLCKISPQWCSPVDITVFVPAPITFPWSRLSNPFSFFPTQTLFSHPHELASVRSRTTSGWLSKNPHLGFSVDAGFHQRRVQSGKVMSSWIFCLASRSFWLEIQYLWLIAQLTSYNPVTGLKSNPTLDCKYWLGLLIWLAELTLDL